MERAVLSLCLWLPFVAAQISVPWRTGRGYGFDGPWQAVTVTVGGWGNGTSADAPAAEVDLLPAASTNTTWVISNQYCVGQSTDTGAVAGLSCPNSNGTLFTAANGDIFVVECGIDYAAGDIPYANTSTQTFAQCIEVCAEKAEDCVAVAYSGVACYPKSVLGTKVYDQAWTARYINSTTPPGVGVCQLGATWNPGIEQTPTGDGLPMSGFQDSNGPSMTGQYYGQAIEVAGSTVVNSTLNAVDSGHSELPNGATVPLDVGFLSLSRNDPVAGLSQTDSSFSTVNLLSGLRNAGAISSQSYGMHIGSVTYNYTGSLVLGGYDVNRIAGPIVYSQGGFQLTDVTIGIESGFSPYASGPKSGLLVSSGADNAIDITLDDLSSYLKLPKQTCDNIAAQLPMSYDANIGYYLWNTHDPLYNATVTSPAWLGFELKPSNSSDDSTLIKIPFGLLNLQLNPPAVVSTVHYFPCTFPSTSGDQAFSLGRAFMQGAFVGANWDQEVTWIAQAAGPGAESQGASQQLVNISTTATTLDVNPDPTAFAASWSSHWTVLTSAVAGAANATASNNSSPSSGQSQSSSKTNTAVIAGAVVGGIVGVAAVAAICAVFLRRRRRNRKSAPSQASLQSVSEKDTPSTNGSYIASSMQEMSAMRDPKELQAGINASELEGQQPQELDAMPELDSAHVQPVKKMPSFKEHI